MWLLQREEHQCSCWLKLHCKQILLYFKHILLYFLLASAVHLIQLPMVLLGGQPRSWGMDLGLCPMCLDDLWVSMQRISAKPFFFFHSIQSDIFKGFHHVLFFGFQQWCSFDFSTVSLSFILIRVDTLS